MKKVEVKIVDEALPFLVKGMSVKSNEEVIGFPYVHMVEDNGQYRYANIIFVPDAESENAFVQHPIVGPMYRYSHRNADGETLFEDVSVENEVVAAANDVASSVSNSDGELADGLRKLAAALFIMGVKWGAEHGVTNNKFKKNDTAQGV